MNQQRRKRGQDPHLPRLLGERLCLDFINTIEGPISQQPEEYLTDYQTFVRWGWHVGLLDEGERDRLLQAAAERPAEARQSYKRVLSVRDTLYAIFVAIARGEQPAEGDLESLKQTYQEALRDAQLLGDGRSYQWVWQGQAASLNQILWAVVQSAVELLTTGDLKLVKECPGAQDCGWLFYDTSKNHSRQWCSMEGCGSRIKMRRAYARKRKSD